MAVLVTGGAGYIGSHTAKDLREKGERVVILDDLSTGFRQATQGMEFIEGSLHDSALLERIICDYNIDSVIHFAAYSRVGESMREPDKYYYNNVSGTINLLNAMVKHNVKHMVFSSTAATFGEPKEVPIHEDMPQNPTSVYGTTKLMIEKILKDYDQAYGLRSVSLRYFNACGADESGLIGEAHNPESHLIPIVLQTVLGKIDSVIIYGTDYPTQDGTCIRDYVHVSDLSSAHILALDALRNGHETTCYNLGNGSGFSVREVIDTVAQVVNWPIPIQEGERRPGDPAILIASSKKIMKELGWEPKFPDLKQIIESAWKWHSAHPNGYKD